MRGLSISGSGLWLMLLCCAQPARGQRPVTLQEAIDSALTRGPRSTVAHADSGAGAARITTARAYPNPQVAFGYSKSPPNYHAELEQEIEYPFLRSARIHAARAGALAAALGLQAERATIQYDVEVAYATTVATVAIRSIGGRNAADARELLRIARERERVGDASQLDVRLATVAAGQAENQAASDSLEATIALLELQALMGMQTDRVDITPSDTAAFAVRLPPSPEQLPLRVAAAQQQLSAERARLQAEKRARIPAPSIRAGFEWRDPDFTGALPTLGFAIPLPFLNRNQGPIAEARAATDRAQATLSLAQLQARAALALAAQERDLMRAKVERGRSITTAAQQVAALALTAYREGEYPLAAVLEAQRSARDAIRQFIEDVQASRMAEAAFVRAHIVGGGEP